MGLEQYSQSNYEKINKTPRQMWAELANIFHAAAGGDHELMVKLNLAYDEYRKNNDSSKLEALYEKWAKGSHGYGPDNKSDDDFNKKGQRVDDYI